MSLIRSMLTETTPEHILAQIAHHLRGIRPTDDYGVTDYFAAAEGFGTEQLGYRNQTGEILAAGDYDTCRRAAHHHRAGSKVSTAAVYARVVIHQAPNPNQHVVIRLP